MQLIDRETVCKQCVRYGSDLSCEDCVVNDAPTVDAMPVVHGEWITDTGENTLHGVNDKCSICGFRNFSFTFFNYCPDCGAKMDGGAPCE